MKGSWIRAAVVMTVALGVLAALPADVLMAAEEEAKSAAAAEPQGHGFLAMAMKAGFMEFVLLFVSIAGVALFLQALTSIKKNLLRPPELAAELRNLMDEGNLEEAQTAASEDDSFLGKTASAVLANQGYGKDAMEGALSDIGEIEASKYMHKIGQLQMIAAIAPMLGLTGTTLGMIMTFSMISAKADSVTAADMAEGISVALVCTFTGLAIAIPLLVGAFYLRANLKSTMNEISADCNEMIRVVVGGGAQGAAD